MNEKFCYWQVDSPNYNSFINMSKICLFRQNEFKLEQESGIKNKTNIFCPYTNKEEAEQCKEYFVSKDLNEKISK